MATPDLSSQIIERASAPLASNYFSDEWSESHSEINGLINDMKNRGVRLPGTSETFYRLLRISFRSVGIVATDQELDDYIGQFEPAFKERTKDKSLQELRSVFGRNIEPMAAIKVVMGALQDEVMQFHDHALDHILEPMMQLGYFVVEQTLLTADPDGGQTVPEPAY